MSRSPKETSSEKNGLWREGVLFHRFKRFAAGAEDQSLDRLIEILKRGLISPGSDLSGRIKSDLNISVTGTETPYDRVVFLHRYSKEFSHPYIISRDPQSIFAFIDDSVTYLTPEEMEDGWPVMSRDEVYVMGSIPPKSIGAIAVHAEIIEEVSAETQEFGVPLYDLTGRRCI